MGTHAPGNSDPEIAERIASSSYFQHLVEKQTDARLAREVRAATHDFLTIRYRIATTVIAFLLGVAGWFGFNTWSRINREIETMTASSAEVRKIKDDVAELHATMRQEATRLSNTVQQEVRDAKTTALETGRDARALLAEYKGELRETRSTEREEFRARADELKSHVADANSKLGQVTDLHTDAEKRLLKLQGSLVKTTDELEKKKAELDKLTAEAARNADLLRNLENYAAAATSELVALRSHSMQTVTMSNPQDSSEAYQMTFISNGLKPPFSLTVKVAQGGGEPRTCELLNLSRGGVRICDTPFEAAEAFTYHTIFSPDFMVFRVKVSSSWLDEQRLKRAAAQ